MKPFGDESGRHLSYNREIYDLLAPLYELRHGEIFNPAEQRRLQAVLVSLFNELKTPTPRALDFGAGTGNLTRHLLKLGADVTAADVSPGILKELRGLLGPNSELVTTVLNGRDLAGMVSSSFDLVATYSVLHHVPDYLGIVAEFVRVTKPGGLIYIDHEVCPSYWEPDESYRSYSDELKQALQSETGSLVKRGFRLLALKNRWRYLCTAFKLRSQPVLDDGDIHVHVNDHIEWPVIREQLESACDILVETDYLLCRERSDPPMVWSRWHDCCSDMRYLVARKR